MAGAIAETRLAVIVRTDTSPGELDRFVDTEARATAYHRPAWTALIGRVFGHETLYLSAMTGGAVTGVLPLVFFRSRVFGTFTVSLPFVNYGGVVGQSAEIESALLAKALEETQARGGTHLELRHTSQMFGELTPRRHKVTMRLPLAESSEAEWDRLDRKVRNQVRKAEKSGLTIQAGGVELVEEFFAVFAHNMRDLGTPVYTRAFFKEILATFPASSSIFVVKHQGAPVAASVVLWHRDVAEVPWASALRSANPLCANVFLYWHMLKFCIERGLRVFDFGRSTPNEGTFHFKKQWGAEPSNLVWEYWTAPGQQVPNLNPSNPKFDLAIRAWQRLPVAVANVVGPFIVRNIP